MVGIQAASAWQSGTGCYASPVVDWERPGLLASHHLPTCRVVQPGPINQSSHHIASSNLLPHCCKSGSPGQPGLPCRHAALTSP